MSKNNILRSLLLMLLTMMMPVVAAAQVWDGSTSTKPAGAGTEDDPYLIASGANLRWLAATSGEWASGKYFVQTADIDLGGNLLYNGLGRKGIGVGSNMPFRGVYDGRGHKIKNMRSEIDNSGSNTGVAQVSYGLFGYVQGTADNPAILRNIVMDGALIEFKNVTNSASVDLKVGVLVGAVGVHAKVQNIAVHNSKITAGEKVANPTDPHPKFTSLYLGGVIGDHTSGFAGTGITDINTSEIRNIYSDVDIDLSNLERVPPAATSDGKFTNYIVGGVLGRARRRGYDDLPDNTFYTGTINAPLAFIGPSWGMARGTANNVLESEQQSAYSGEYMFNSNNTNNYYTIGSDNASAVTAEDAARTRFFGDYRIYNAVADETQQITADYPPETYLGNRTFSATGGTGNFDLTSIENMQVYQGVNHATYADLDNDADHRKQVLTTFRSYAKQDASLMSWVYRDGKLTMSDAMSMALNQTSPNTYRAVVVWPLDDNYTFVWKINGTEVHRSIGTPDTNNVYCDYDISLFSYTGNISVEVYDHDGNIVIDEDEELFIRTLHLPLPGEIVKLKLNTVEVNNGSGPAPGYVATVSFKANNTVLHGGGSINVDGSASTDAVRNADFAWLWEVTSDPSSISDWESTNLHSFFETEHQQAMDAPIADGSILTQQNWIVPYNAARYYRASWVKLLRDDEGNYVYKKDAHGNDIYTVDRQGNTTRIHDYKVLMEDVVGPRNLIFVYDEQKTRHGRDLGVTTFDGIDASHGDPFPDGDDLNTGHTPYTAVKTIKRAYELLDPALGRDGNVIVIMGYYYDDVTAGENPSWAIGSSSNYTNATHRSSSFLGSCTFTGSHGDLIYDGSLNMANATSNVVVLEGHTAFHNINWIGYLNPELDTPTLSEICLYANTFDLHIGENVKMLKYKTMKNENGLLEGEGAPYVTIVGGPHNWDEPGMPNYDLTGQVNPGFTTITVLSGAYGRIVSSARNNGAHYNSHNTFANPATPYRAKVKVAIAHNRAEDDPDRMLEYCDQKYSFDVGLVTGGQTDGTIYAENVIDIEEGNIGRFISGNISYGRDVNKEGENFPSDSYFGSTTINLYNGKITELYGGSLGRHAENNLPAPTVNCYFYGRSILNLHGGEVSGNIYGAGAGGVTGVGDDTYHTTDTQIPFYRATGTPGEYRLDYAPYDTVRGQCADGRTLEQVVPTLPLADGGELDLYHSYVEVNLYGGVVKGDIYGGGYGYTSYAKYDKALPLAGTIFGNAYVRMLKGNSIPPMVYGSIFGAGCGSSKYYNEAIKAGHPEIAENFTTLGLVVGDAEVTLESGTVLGNVYGAGAGVKGENFTMMGGLVGNTHVTINGVTVNGNIFGGSQVANVLHHRADEYADKPEHSGNTKVDILGGTIGNNIFGGCEGYFVSEGSTENSTGIVYGSTHVKVLGGSYIGNPFVTDTEGRYELVSGDVIEKHLYNAATHGERRVRTFNIYGGGYVDCDVMGSTRVDIEKALLDSVQSIEAPRMLTDDERFMRAFDDLKYRRFCVYGGGYGVNAPIKGMPQYTYRKDEGGNDIYVPATQVNINIVSRNNRIVELSDGREITSLIKGQTIFDVAGGGYSGHVGYWTKVDYEKDAHGDYILDTNGDKKPIEATRVAIDDMIAEGITPTCDDYCEYINGDVQVTIEGNPFIRKVFGGGFYASVNNASTRIFSGTINEVYGGALLGYIHNTARLQVGTLQDDPGYTADQVTFNNNHLFINRSVYGGNDVKGIIGTVKWKDLNYDPADDAIPGFGLDKTDGRPLYSADVNDREDRGVNLFLFGGSIRGNVYGAGNGHYRGYYVPGWLRYEDGGARHYRQVRSVHPEFRNPSNPANRSHLEDPAYVSNLLLDETGTPRRDSHGRVIYTGNVYRSQPMVGSVKIYIGGNSTSDRVNIDGNVYGGGRSCTIGQWNTILPFEDPRRLATGGFLHLNFGSHVHVGGNLYLGVSGNEYATQSTIDPAMGIDLATFDGSDTEELNRLGEAAYEHWYFDNDLGYYKPGFPAPGETEGNFNMTGGHLYRAYLKKIEMNGNVELTFYNDPFKTDAQGNHIPDGRGGYQRKGWVPGELAVKDYDATDIVFNSVFLGGECGSMTNNRMMCYDYDNNTPIAPDNITDPNADFEKYGSIYRVTLPYGVTIKDKVVGGSESAVTKAYRYTDDGTALITTRTVTNAQGETVEEKIDPDYIYEGGIVTQEILSYGLIVYADRHGIIDSAQPVTDWQMTPDDPSYNEHTLKDGTKIYRRSYSTNNPFYSEGNLLNKARFSVAEVRKDGKVYSYIGPYTMRHAYMTENEDDDEFENTALKLTISCAFDPQKGDPLPSHSPAFAGQGNVDDHRLHFGGVIYGGCYNSGVTDGDIVINVTSDLLGGHMDSTDPESFLSISSLKYNLGRVFGGGYGPESRVEGDTYVNVLHNFVGMNVFGGGCRGDVMGTANVNYVGSETDSYIYGAIYGGGLYGSVGKADITRKATEVNLVSGNVDHVYGGSCLGNLYGRAEVNLTDKVEPYYSHFDYRRIRKIDPTFDTWAGSRLIVGHVFGGNDVSGSIYLPDAPTAPATPLDESNAASVKEWQKYQQAMAEYEAENKYSTTVHIWEEKDESNSPTGSSGQMHNPIGPGKTSPGSANGYNGFPFVGYLFGGSNGNYGVHSGADYYEDGVLELASGDRNSVMHLQLGGQPVGDPDAPAGERRYGAFELPHLDYSRIIINGGTIVNAFGGGDKSTVSRQTDIYVEYLPDNGDVKGNMDARAGFADRDELTRVWNLCHLTSDEQISEVATVDSDGNTIFDRHVLRLFGGNNHADMDIQPTWHLVRGHVGSVYSGGNFGAMTYCHTEPSATPGAYPTPLHGIRLAIDSREFHADNVYGGGRVGNVDPDFSAIDPALLDDNGNLKDPGDFYGALLEIDEGVIDHVYGGNDVSGNVKYGTKVQISGAISGDVYCAGNGNYRYKYDPTLPPGSSIIEDFDESIGGRYFILPQNPVYGGDNPTSGAQKLLAINSYRPNVERAFLSIGGRSPDHVAYVRGNVYCGGNSSSVHPSMARDNANSVIFHIGDNVVLNGVFLGSNGENMTAADAIASIQSLNNIDLTADNTITQADLDMSAAVDNDAYTKALRDYSDADGIIPATDHTVYPSLLDLYMRAVEVSAVPKDFELSPTLSNAYIGSFYVGGNCGSMMTDERIFLTFPESLVIYDKIVGGSNNATFTLGDVTHSGGLRVPVNTTPDAQGHVNTEKVHLVVKNSFEPWRLNYPVDNDYTKIRMLADVDELNGIPVFSDRKCMVYGGGYTSGTTVGDISIDIFSDMVKEYAPTSKIGKALADSTVIGKTATKKRVIVNGINDDSRRSFGVVGAGYGSGTEVLGNIRVRLLPGKVHPTYNATATEERPYVSDKSPSASVLFGGSVMGKVVGNTSLEVRDGLVLTNTYGASEASVMYGSTNTVVGWPEYYRCTESHKFLLNRTDNLSEAAKDGWKSNDGRPAVMDTIAIRAGEIISRPLYYQIKENIDGVSKSSCFTLVDNDLPQNFDTLHGTEFGDGSYTSGLTWDDINVSIGYRNSSFAPGSVESELDDGFYGHGNIYGGGFVSAKSAVSLAGQYTVRRFTDKRCLDPADVGYGGNSIILVWDNRENSYLNFKNGTATGTVATNDGLSTVTGSGAAIRDHVSVGTARYTPVSLGVGNDVIGKYVWSPAHNHYLHQSSHVLGTDATGHKLADPNSDPAFDKDYYEIECDGGIYGGGRKVYIEGFRHCDLSYYGYADYTPQHPKLLNTFQRLDLLSVTDCCLQLQGANDFATNNVDATHYSLTRIGELQMISSVNTNDKLNPGVRQDTGLCNIIHDTPRIRNYIAFFNSVRYVAAITSSQAFDAPFHGANGELYSTSDHVPLSQAQRHKPDVPGIDWADYPQYKDLPNEYSYVDFKKNRIDNYYALRSLPVPSDSETSDRLIANQKVKIAASREFDQRNIGTAANMIGINNGYTLKVQGAVVDENGVDKTYYGPATGVMEVKLLTLAQNEGGGYIFALNHHDDPNNFLETTGNFVFPGAAYLVSSEEDQRYNYVYDDCFPMGRGWDTYVEQGDCNELQDIHYWYVNGTNYFYNVTLTAYTYNGNIDFTLDNNDQLIYLYGLQSGNKLKISDVSWTASKNIDSDIMNVGVDGDNHYLKDYKLFLSVDKNPTYAHTNDPSGSYYNNAFISPIPRANYSEDGGGSGDPLVTMSNSEVVNNYKDYDDDANMPLLGISLIDNVDNTTKAYYDAHLAEPEQVRIELVGDENGIPFKYVINLTVKYLLGPSISGLPVIENGALPGEYIYANSFGVNVDLDDDNMAVTGRNWYIVAPEYHLDTQSDIRAVIDGIGSTNPATRTIGEKLINEKFDSDCQVHIPAYWYRNGWHIIYEIVANNMSFYLHPDRDLSQVEGQVKPYTDHLVVHNYHRMRPYDGVSMETVDGVTRPKLEDLRLTRGARIYIEDDNDMAYFYQWLDSMQTDRGRRSPRGYHIDPQYADSLYVFLMADVKMPAVDPAKVRSLEFRGTFNGMGHSIDMGTNEVFLGINSGAFYNTGFISQRTNSSHHSHANVFDNNPGIVENCFFYNTKDLANGYLVNPAHRATSIGHIVNTYRTSHDGLTEDYENLIPGEHGLVKASTDEFKYGKIAYNLNRFYLVNRYLDGLHLKHDDINVDADSKRAMTVIDDMFADGNYRFASWSVNGDTTALRTADIPNYHDRLAIRSHITKDTYNPTAGVTGHDASFHNGNDWVDERRADREDPNDPTSPIVLNKFGQATYHPIESDYIFFGQDLTAISSETPYPHTIDRTAFTNRVYRASGYYGSHVDQGFHFNPSAQAVQPSLTAIDFTGFSVARHGNTYRKGDVTSSDEVVFYPPMLDYPDAGLEAFTTSAREVVVNNETLSVPPVTRNLLVYQWADDEAMKSMYYGVDTPEDYVFGHVINPVPGGADGLPLTDEANRPTTQLLHLVDREDFNCPIAFEVSDTAWYQRHPDVWASVGQNGYTGWDGVVLPFTVHKVIATADGDINHERDHGELSHFYGPYEPDNVEAPSHEYWLRKFTAADGDRLIFHRPGADEDNNLREPERTDYKYSNTYFSRAYGGVYDDGTTHSRPEYTEAGRTHFDYPLVNKGFPYIVAWPGEKFYEFDLSGEFYNSIFPSATKCSQVINFTSFGAAEGGKENVMIPITDANPPLIFNHDGFQLTGTYMHRAPDAYTAVVDGDGCNFERADASKQWAVDPFRVYMVMPSSRTVPMPIISRGIGGLDDGQHDDGDGNGDDDRDAQLEVFVENNVLCIMSPFEDPFDLPLFDVTGRLLRYLHVVDGQNLYPELNTGFYITAGTKFRIN